MIKLKINKSVFAIVFSMIVLAVQGCQTTNMCVSYVPQQNAGNVFNFRFNDTDPFQQSVQLISYQKNVRSKSPFFFQLKYSGRKTYAEKLLSMDFKIFSRDPVKDEFTKEIKPVSSYTSFSSSIYYYFNDPSRLKDYKGSMNDLINKRDERNTEKTVNYFYLDREYDMNELPGEIRVDIDVRWQDGEENFSVILRPKERYCPDKVRTNPFG